MTRMSQLSFVLLLWFRYFFKEQYVLHITQAALLCSHAIRMENDCILRSPPVWQVKFLGSKVIRGCPC